VIVIDERTLSGFSAEDSGSTARRNPATARSVHPCLPKEHQMNATGLADPTEPNPALMSGLTTERYTLQSARASTIAEANGRSMLFPSAVRGATVVLASVAHLDRVGDTFLTFALSVLLALGVTSYSRLANHGQHHHPQSTHVLMRPHHVSFYLSIKPPKRPQPRGDQGHAPSEGAP
jgi:hypothetical protein